jgi:hypothetical protein
VLAERHCGVHVVAVVRGGADVGSQSIDTIKLNFMGLLVVPTGLGSKPLTTFRV